MTGGPANRSLIVKSARTCDFLLRGWRIALAIENQEASPEMSSSFESPNPQHHRRLVGALARGWDVLLPLGAASWLVSFGVMEWSFPYCSSQADGPATAVFGFPLPFMRMSEVTSLTIYFLPHAYLLDVVLVGGALLALGNLVRARLPSVQARRFLLGGLGAALLMMQMLWHGVFLARGVEVPMTSIL